MKAKQCDECKNFKHLPWCKKGHKPRFYKPANLSDAHSGNWGFKRRCADFKELIK